MIEMITLNVLLSHGMSPNPPPVTWLVKYAEVINIPNARDHTSPTIIQFSLSRT